MKKYKIGWQKYEDVIEQQLSSPAMKNLMRNMIMNNQQLDDEKESNDYDLQEDELEEADNMLMIPLSEKVINELSIASSFDCWVGHTNFDITFKIRDKLNSIAGIEILKIFSRYRFFVGIGKMFDFKDVRSVIEKEIVPKEQK